MVKKLAHIALVRAVAARLCLGGIAGLFVAASTGLCVWGAEPSLVQYNVVGDSIPAPLTGHRGDPARGKAIVLNRRAGLCLLCHPGPFSEEKFQGTIGPDLAGSGSRWTEAQLRMRMVDASRINPATIMPSYYRIDALNHVAPAFRGKPVLSAEQIEDVVAFLTTLRD
ncbi:MAG TPA: sulfur oxidation c-type cytochrome SoxX [Xanthobacteraceae bacterium]|nr:sulfur oxidation c-type cytochrome SoxX [Xanthobacteraceae bacterium]